jgi:tryptophan 7-halogenase
MSGVGIKSVVIVGGGVSGWLSAAVLATMLGSQVEISLVDCQDGTGAPTACATLPPLKAINAMLGIDEAQLLTACAGTMKLGSQFVNWGALGNRYIHPHGSYGADFDVVGVHHWWLKARAADATLPDLASYCLSAELIKQGRFMHPVPDRRMIQSTLDYAYHLDESRYCDLLASLAQSRGVGARVAQVKTVNLDSDTGHVKSLLLSDGQTLCGDFFIDCTGLERRLIGEALGASFQDWSHRLACDQSISLTCHSSGEFTPATRITAREAGWQWRTPLQGKTSMGYVFSSAHISADDALATLMENLDGPVLTEARVQGFTNGRLATPFYKNVVAIGDSAGYLEPLEATGLHMVQSALMRLLALWPNTHFNPSLARAYNEVAATEWDRASDFLFLHYHASTRSDTLFWRDCATRPLSDEASQRLDHWKASGRIISPGPELFQSPSWLSVYHGQNVPAGGWDPIADYRAGQVDFVARLSGLAAIVAETAASAPEHKSFIDKFARAKPA